jgi:hypothetical protein
MRRHARRVELPLLTPPPPPVRVPYFLGLSLSPCPPLSSFSTEALVASRWPLSAQSQTTSSSPTHRYPAKDGCRCAESDAGRANDRVICSITACESFHPGRSVQEKGLFSSGGDTGPFGPAIEIRSAITETYPAGYGLGTASNPSARAGECAPCSDRTFTERLLRDILAFIESRPRQ